MRVNSVSIINENLRIERLKFDFSKYGVNIITGENGSGKTSIIEKIMFECNDIQFNEPDQLESFKKDKSSVFTYIPQNILSYNVSVEKYITKSNKQINDEFLNDLLSRFKFEKSILKQKFNKLSGGEKIKIAIISGMLKDTPYIFMDEPSNNLDDFSTQILLDLINELKKDRTFIIITHDPRLKFENCNKIIIENNNKIENTAHTENGTNKKICKTSNSKNYFSLAYKLFKTKSNLVIAFLTICIGILLAFYTEIQYYEGYNDQEIPPDNIIVTYKAEHKFGKLNKVYYKAANLKLDSSKKTNLIKYHDIPEISKIEGVEKIILQDMEKHMNINTAFYEDNLINDLQVYAVPNIVIENYIDFLGQYWIMDHLIEGRFPKDYQNEITISKSLLKKYFNYSEDMIENALGSKVTFKNQDYTIVGLHTTDVCFLSYTDDNNFGFYTYEKETYNDFTSSIIHYKERMDYADKEGTNFMMIFTQNGYEKNVLDKLMKTYPAENYYSAKYTDYFKRYLNKNFIFKVLGINFILASIVSLLLLFFTKEKILIDKKKIRDFENYYIDKKEIKNNYLVINIIMYILIFLAIIVFNNYYSVFSYSSNYVIIFTILFMLLPSYIYLFFKVKNA
ncbi:MAG: ATP-binding cassette domain-containing protein [Eubacteriales bacterium]